MMSLLPFSLRLVFSALFLVGGISKLYNLELTELVVAETKLFNWSVVAVVAKLLASIEIILGILIFFNPFPRNLPTAFLLSPWYFSPFTWSGSWSLAAITKIAAVFPVLLPCRPR